MKPWWERGPLTFEGLLIVLVIMMMILLAGLLTINSAHASGCLSIDVPPQAVLYNHDGDTFTVFTFAAGGAVKIRVEGVDTPELKEPQGNLAKEFTRQWLANGIFHVETCGKPTLDRIVAKVSRNGRTLAQDLLDGGLTK